MDLKNSSKVLILSILCYTVLYINVIHGKEGVSVADKLDVIVVGGGIAGIVAARKIAQHGKMNVRILEGRKDRYGGRIWTNRQAGKGVKGVDVELGGMFFNTWAKNVSMIELAEKFELRMQNAGSIKHVFSDVKGARRVLVGDDVNKLYAEAFKVIISAIKKVKDGKVDRSLEVAIQEEIELLNSGSKVEEAKRKDILKVIKSLPVYLLEDFSTLLYKVDYDFGWDTVLVDGVDSFIDTIVGGENTEVPLKVDLNKVVRNIKVDDARQKVLVRTTDRKQLEADAVVVALPAGVLKSNKVYFEPLLSKEWHRAMENIQIGYSMKVVVGFEKAFWPKDVGMFVLSSKETDEGFLQSWVNSYSVSGNPYLTGNIFGKKALSVENWTDDKLKEKVLTVLGELFGDATVRDNKMVTFVRSNWSSDPLSMGSMTYPKVGSTSEVLDMLQQPVCPYIYFAGAHTELDGHIESLHGAYKSGIRAAEQLLTDVCDRKKYMEKAKKGGYAQKGKGDSKSDNKRENVMTNVKKSNKTKSLKDEL